METVKHDPRMLKARSQLVLRPGWGFYACLAFLLELEDTETVTDTMATDMKKVYYKKSFLDELMTRKEGIAWRNGKIVRVACTGADLILGVYVHEIVHCAEKHPARIGRRELEMANHAADYRDNISILKAGFILPVEALIDLQYDNLGFEDIYNILKRQKQQPQPQPPQTNQQKQEQDSDSGEGDSDEGKDEQDGDDSESDDGNEDGEGEGEGGNSEGDNSQSDSGGDESASGDESGDGKGTPKAGNIGGCGSFIPMPGTPNEKAELEHEWNINVRQAIMVAIKAAGDIPGHLANLVKEVREPKQDWRARLREFIDPSSRKDYSFAKPNRRYMGTGFMLPSLVTDGVNHIVLIVDASGSCSPEIQTAFRSEVQGVLDDGNVDRITVIFCDTRVYETCEYMNGDTIEPFKIQGGGTRFSPAFKWLNENVFDASACIYFTDMEPGDMWDSMPQPTCPVLWAAYGDPRYLRAVFQQVPFGDIIEINEGE